MEGLGTVSNYRNGTKEAKKEREEVMTGRENGGKRGKHN